MRRVWLVSGMLLSVSLGGCGRKSYEDRLDRTIKQLEYDRRLRKNLMDPPGEKKFQDLTIYVRPPKEESLKPGGLPVGEGQFDLDASFVDKTDSTLYLLARVKMPKKAPAKGAPPPPPPPQRGEFVNDVLGVLTSLTGSAEGLPAPKFVEEVKKGNRFKRAIFNANDKEVKVYTYKQDNHEVALIFVYGTALRNAISSKIDLCLESFATGPKAARLYSNGGAQDEEVEATAPLPQ